MKVTLSLRVLTFIFNFTLIYHLYEFTADNDIDDIVKC